MFNIKSSNFGYNNWQMRWQQHQKVLIEIIFDLSK